MNLDSRIIKGKTYLDCFDIEEAKQFIGKQCYFSDSPRSFANIDNINVATLTSIDGGDIHPYKLENTRWRYATNLILPYEWIKEPEKKDPKYRPFTLDEFTKRFSLGDEVIVRRKGERNKIRHRLFVEYTEDEIQIVHLGSYWFTFEELFDEYELLTNENWKPFGIKE